MITNDTIIEAIKELREVYRDLDSKDAVFGSDEYKWKVDLNGSNEPTHIICKPEDEEAALKVLNSTIRSQPTSAYTRLIGIHDDIIRGKSVQSDLFEFINEYCTHLENMY